MRADKLYVDTPLGKLVAYASGDSNSPGIYIELYDEDSQTGAPLAFVEYAINEDDTEATGDIITHVWEDIMAESQSMRIIHTGMEEYFMGLSPNALALKKILDKSGRLDSIAESDILCIGYCPKEGEQSWLFRYKNIYAILYDLGGDNYSFKREVHNINALAYDTDDMLSNTLMSNSNSEQEYNGKKDGNNMIGETDLDIYRKVIDKALISVGKEYGIEIRCGKAKYRQYDFCFELTGFIKTEAVDGPREIFNQYADLYGFSPDDYGKEFTLGGKQYRFTGFMEESRINTCRLLCLDDNTIYVCRPQLIHYAFTKAQASMKTDPEPSKATLHRAVGSPEKIVTFFVAECMEFYNLGEYHEGLNVKKAVEIYNTIPSERSNSVKGIGIIIHQDGKPKYTDLHYHLMQLLELDPGVLEYAGEDRLLVWGAYQDLIDCLEDCDMDYTIKDTAIHVDLPELRLDRSDR